MKAGYQKKELQTSPIIPEPANDGLHLLARMIVQLLLKQQTKSNFKLDGAKPVDIPTESNSLGGPQITSEYKRG